jgi:hypothetical protein
LARNSTSRLSSASSTRDAGEERGNDDRGGELGRDGCRLEEVQLGEPAGGEELRHELLERLEGELVRRDQAEEEHRRPGLSRGRAASQRRRPRQMAIPTVVPRPSARVGWRRTAAAKAIGERWSGLEDVLQLVEALVYQEPPHVSPG